jgi:hypothetical protein
VIILEGCDRTGKTTVAKALRSLLPGWSYRHHTVPPAGLTCYEYHLQFLADSHARVIVDRLHWSDYAYRKVYGGDQMTLHRWRCIELAAMSRNATVLLMTDTIANITSRWTEREMYTGRVAALWDAYVGLDEKSSQRKSMLPSVGWELSELVSGDGAPTKHLVEIAQLERERCAIDLLPASLGYGNPKPEFLVLGEAPGGVAEGHAPQLPWDTGPSSELLWRALDQIELQWWRGYYTNASAFATPQDFAKYYDLLGRPQSVLCLGQIAGNFFTAAKKNEHWPCSSSPIFRAVAHHPAYVRRFHHDEFDSWVKDQIEPTLKYYCDRRR